MGRKNEARKRDIKIAITVLILCMIGVGIILVKRSIIPSGETTKLDSNARLGQLKGKSEEEIVAELNKIVEEGTFNISINTSPKFEDGKSEGNLQIENVPSNRYLMKVKITLNDTERKVYESGYIDTNYHIQSAKLDTELSKGEYPATATFTAYDKQTKQAIGSAAASIVISVLN